MPVSIAKQLNINTTQVKQVLALLQADATIPFIARYRKEASGGLDEVQIGNIRDLHHQNLAFEERKNSIIKSLKEQNIYSIELQKEIDSLENKTSLEDFYLPYKPKRKTKGSTAKENGLEGLAKMMMSQTHSNIQQAANSFINAKVKTPEEALNGAKDIIAEWINENPYIRKKLRYLFWQKGSFSSKVIKGKEDDAQSFQMYFDHSESLGRTPAHRILAMMRGENEGFLRLKTEATSEEALTQIEQIIVKRNSSNPIPIKEAIKDAYKRLLNPSLQSEIKKELKIKADKKSIDIFAKNLKELLLAPPLKGKRVMAIDPGFRTGCKVVCLSENGDLLHNETIYPHAPQREHKQAMHKINSLSDAYKVEVIAIGNGTAGKETEAFIRKIHFKKPIKAIMVNESGASVYSASTIAREEFPQYDITVRGAVSIGRRLIDPLSELVKIDPKAIGVGQYQHDVDQKLLSKSLDDMVMSSVNAVGVDLNTASKQLLTYISGLGTSLAQNIIDHRKTNGDFTNRQQLLKVKRLGEKAFQQAAGFLRINNGDQILDSTSVHPESYHIVNKMAKDLSIKPTDLIAAPTIMEKIEFENYLSSETGIPTLIDIKKELLKPGFDPREEYEEWDFDPNINHLNDLTIGTKLKGIITNITAFGAFVDVGVHQDGLVHKSNLANEFVKDPNDFVHIGQKVWVKVLDVDKIRKRIQFSMKF